MHYENIEAIEVKYGSAVGLYDPGSKLIKISIDGKQATLALEAVMENSQLIADCDPDVAYTIGWLASHAAITKQIMAWVAAGILVPQGLEVTAVAKH